jgi:hypothetical protein
MDGWECLVSKGEHTSGGDVDDVVELHHNIRPDAVLDLHERTRGEVLSRQLQRNGCDDEQLNSGLHTSIDFSGVMLIVEPSGAGHRQKIHIEK